MISIILMLALLGLLSAIIDRPRQYGGRAYIPPMPKPPSPAVFKPYNPRRRQPYITLSSAP
jgi:hypothetical protein